MGRDKAYLPLAAGTLAAHVAAVVVAAAGPVTLVGDPARYGRLGYPVVADRFPGAGPLAGIHAALASTAAVWNLVVACDMPRLEAPFLRSLLEAAERSGAGCLVPRGPTGLPEPLCAVYHRDARPALERALARGVRRVSEALAALDVVWHDCPDVTQFKNLNTPEEWAAHARQ
jgi:molybdopterin-guanine dinucleotide biosynthesis protein A